MRQMLIKINKEEELLYPASGYILGVRNYSICFSKSFSLDEIKKIKDENRDKKIFVSLNRLIFNDELELYKNTLKKLDDMNLDGIIVGDIAALTYNLKTRLILDQMHLNNSSYSIKHYFDNNVSGFVLTNDITLYEINKIKENNKDGSYYIYEDYFGTHILSKYPINLLKYINLLDVDYFIFDSFLLKTNEFVYDAFYTKDLSLNEKINDTFNANEGFINKETIYKVKKND